MAVVVGVVIAGYALMLIGWVRTFALYVAQLRRNEQLEVRLAAEQAVRESEIRAVRAELEAVRQTSQQQVAAAVQEMLNVRQRWTVDAIERIRGEAWIVVLAAALEDCGRPIPPPPEIHVRPRSDESDYYPQIDAAREARLQAMVREQLAATGDVPLGPTASTVDDLVSVPPAAG